jgi:ketosteroid isomerase-like protein
MSQLDLTVTSEERHQLERAAERARSGATGIARTDRCLQSEVGMKIKGTVGVLLLLTLGALAQASDEETVRSRDDQERIAALKRDASALEGLWSEHFTVNAPNNQVVVGKRAVMETFIRAGIINFSSFERDVEFARVDGDFAVLMGLETLVPIADAPAAGLTAGKKVVRRFTNIWKREAGEWRLFWRHANVVERRI